MKNNVKNLVKTQTQLDILKEHLKGKITINYDIQTLTLSNEIGTGQARYSNLQDGIQTIDLNIELLQDTEIPINCVSSKWLQFVYCLEGSFHHQFEKFEKSVKIEQFQTAVVHSDIGLSSNIIVKKGMKLILNIIYIDKEIYFENVSRQSNKFGKNLQDLLYNIKMKPKHLHVGNYNLKISEQLKVLFGAEHCNEVCELLSQKGRYYLILAKHIEQFHVEIENKSNTSGLLKNELKRISELSDYIRQQPEIQHSIKSLSFQSGLTPVKLQDGFRFVFNRTVSDYVRNVRLDKAEQLIKTTDLTISEVVYSVGFTSRSYFSKIFKKKYHCTPKDYKTVKYLQPI